MREHRQLSCCSVDFEIDACASDHRDHFLIGQVGPLRLEEAHAEVRVDCGRVVNVAPTVRSDILPQTSGEVDRRVKAAGSVPTRVPDSADRAGVQLAAGRDERLVERALGAFAERGVVPQVCDDFRPPCRPPRFESWGEDIGAEVAWLILRRLWRRYWRRQSGRNRVAISEGGRSERGVVEVGLVAAQ